MSLICTVVREESIYLKTADPTNPKELIDLSNFLTDGTLSVCEIEHENEQSLYVDLASVLDDGEAMTLAIAMNRGHSLVTDERKARRLFLERTNSPKRLISTSDLIRNWVDHKKISSTKLRDTLQKIELRASYRPSNTDQNQQWWMTAIR
jgi:hypothetical protein